jgi:hypothetical protein
VRMCTAQDRPRCWCSPELPRADEAQIMVTCARRQTGGVINAAMNAVAVMGRCSAMSSVRFGDGVRCD